MTYEVGRWRDVRSSRTLKGHQCRFLRRVRADRADRDDSVKRVAPALNSKPKDTAFCHEDHQGWRLRTGTMVQSEREVFGLRRPAGLMLGLALGTLAGCAPPPAAPAMPVDRLDGDDDGGQGTGSGGASITRTGTNPGAASARTTPGIVPSGNWRRQSNSRLRLIAWRSAIAATDAPGRETSSTSASFCSSVQRRRRATTLMTSPHTSVRHLPYP